MEWLGRSALNSFGKGAKRTKRNEKLIETNTSSSSSFIHFFFNYFATRLSFSRHSQAYCKWSICCWPFSKLTENWRTFQFYFFFLVCFVLLQNGELLHLQKREISCNNSFIVFRLKQIYAIFLERSTSKGENRKLSFHHRRGEQKQKKKERNTTTTMPGKQDKAKQSRAKQNKMNKNLL